MRHPIAEPTRLIGFDPVCADDQGLAMSERRRRESNGGGGIEPTSEKVRTRASTDFAGSVFLSHRPALKLCDADSAG